MSAAGIHRVDLYDRRLRSQQVDSKLLRMNKHVGFFFLWLPVLRYFDVRRE